MIDMGQFLFDNPIAAIDAIELMFLTERYYAPKICAKNPNHIMMIIPKPSRRYYGRTEIRLCNECREENKRASIRKSQYRRFLKNQSDTPINVGTHSTPKKRAYEVLAALLQYVDETRNE